MNNNDHFEIWEYHDDKIIENTEFMPQIYIGNHLSVMGDVFYKGHPFGNAFFKVIRLKEKGCYNTINGICRISMISPEYIKGYDSNTILFDNEIDEIINMFKENDYNMWKYLIEQENIIFKSLNIPFQFDSINYKMPNYNLLKKGY